MNKSFKTSETKRELTKHITNQIPIALYKTTLSYKHQPFIPLHWHEEIQFIYVTKGTILFQVNEQQQKVTEGQALFINSNALHQAFATSDEASTYCCLNILPSLLLNPHIYEQFVSPYIQATNLTKFLISQQNLLQQLKSFIEQFPSLQPLQILTEINALWQLLIVNITPATNETNFIRSSRMKTMLHFIHENYDKKLSLNQIAKAGFLSTGECCRYFKTYVQRSPIQYVTKYRLQKSELLLKTTDYTITQIAHDVGFSGASYFIEQFKQHYAITPKQFRQQ